MKLRLRSLRSKETLKLEVPDQCTLQQLKEILSHTLSSPSSLASSLRFSLNRKDELSSPSPQDSLPSIGITSGDLIFFSLNPDDFSSSDAQTVGESSVLSFQTQAQRGNLQSQSVNLQESESFDSNTSAKPKTLVQCLSSDIRFQESGSKKCEISQESEVVAMDCSNQQTESPGVSTPKKEAQVQNLSTEGPSRLQEGNLETRDLGGGEGMNIGPSSSSAGGKRISAPNFLKRVLTEEIAEDFSDKKLLFLAIHAVFLESGFVGFDPVSGLRVDLFHLLQEQPLMSYTTSVSYTLPELLSDDNVTESVILTFQTIGHYVNVYGYLPKCQSGLHKLNLDRHIFVPTIGTIWAYFDNPDRLNEIDGSSICSAENVIFHFWKIVKDQLVLPLLIDLCEKTGLDLPPCLMPLPAEIKLRILEFLPGQYIARMACVCKEMQYLSSNNDLWKEKFAEEFGGGMKAEGTTNWKSKFAASWESRKKQKTPDCSFGPGPLTFSRNIRDLRVPPGVIGGDYDRLPHGAVPAAFGQYDVSSRRVFQQFDLASRRLKMRRNFSPNCNLGGFNA